MQAIRDFFLCLGTLLKAFNAAIITLVPKCIQPQRVSDYIPISCCNTFSKFILKILANGLKHYLPSLISKTNVHLWKEERSWIISCLLRNLSKLS